jgi:hypothetical protein
MLLRLHRLGRRFDGLTAPHGLDLELPFGARVPRAIGMPKQTATNPSTRDFDREQDGLCWKIDKSVGASPTGGTGEG